MADPFFSTSWYRVADLKPRLQPHVDIHRHRYRGHTWYVLHDHATGRVHRFTPASYLLIGNMNGERTLDEIWKAAAVQLEENAPSQDEVVRLLSQLHSSDLLRSDGPPETLELLERLSRQRWRLLGRKFRNPIAITIPLWDPNRFLDRAVSLLRPLKVWHVVAAWIAVVFPAVAMLALYSQELTENLPDRVLAANNLILLALIFPLVKFLHELGHGLAVKAYGGAVHDAGVMLLIFFPVPYVDATASLAFRSKYARALVGAAGMIVELFIAGLAAYVWLLAEIGAVKAIAFDVILVAGVSTIIVNGNPLLRFDGYYILSDLIEIPNLGSRSNRLWASLIEKHVFGALNPRPNSVLPSERVWLFLYAPISYAYRLLVFVGIALFVATEYLFVGVVIALWSLHAALVMPVFRIVRHLLTSSTLAERRVRAIALSSAGLAVAAALVLLVPAPLSTVSEGVVWLPEDAQVRSGTSSFLQRIAVASGNGVRKDDALLEFREPNLEAKVVAQRYRVAELETRHTSQEFADRVGAALTRQELEAEKSELNRLEERVRRLMVRSPRDGTFIAVNPDDMVGRWAPEGKLLGFVVADEPRVVRAVVTQDNIELVRDHLRSVEAKIADRRSETFAASVVREVPAARNELPSKALGTTGGGRIATDPRDADGNTVLERVFQFDVRLSPTPSDLYYGTRVYLRFSHAWEPLGVQWYRRLRQLFLSHFDV